MIENGNVVEYIDRQRIICAVVRSVSNKKLRLLNENDREVKLSADRLSHISDVSLGPLMSRYTLVETLKKTSARRNDLATQVNIKELWEVLNAEQKWVDLATITELCFPDNPTEDHKAAVVRAFFQNRLYFKFDHNRFFPSSEKKLAQLAAQQEEADLKTQIIKNGGAWLKSIFQAKNSFKPEPFSPEQKEYIEILKSIYILEKESRQYTLGKAMLEKAGIASAEIFQLLLKLGVWDADKNTDIYKYNIPVSFPDKITNYVKSLIDSRHEIHTYNGRKDFTGLPVITIDGQATLDFDDALSIEETKDYYHLGIHIADVGHFIKKQDAIDQEAIARGSSIYMLDQKVPMLPECLADDLCSLKLGELRPAISIMVKLNKFAEIIDFEIVPSLVRVKQQLTYYDVNMVADHDREIGILYDIAKHFREFRLDSGAVQINLPEINIRMNEASELTISKIQRESPGRMLVAEIMIMANWLMARFLAKNGVPAIFRTQPEPRERLYKKNTGTLFQNWMQRKLLSRYTLKSEPKHHSGLGLEAYVTATSPIRRYYDLATQRQVRAILGLEEPYDAEQIQQIIQLVEQPVIDVLKVQNNRRRYWLLKYLETRINQKEEAIVLFKKRNTYQVLIKEYVIECELPVSSGIELRPKDLVQIRIQHANARKGLLYVYMG